MKLSEIYDVMGWAISKNGNKIPIPIPIVMLVLGLIISLVAYGAASQVRASIERDDQINKRIDKLEPKIDKLQADVSQIGIDVAGIKGALKIKEK